MLRKNEHENNFILIQLKLLVVLCKIYFKIRLSYISNIYYNATIKNKFNGEILSHFTCILKNALYDLYTLVFTRYIH